jgi:hypothetical protein
MQQHPSICGLTQAQIACCDACRQAWLPCCKLQCHHMCDPPPTRHPLQAQQLLDQLSQVPTKRAAADICAALLQAPLEGDADALGRLTAAMQQLLSGEGAGSSRKCNKPRAGSGGLS